MEGDNLKEMADFSSSYQRHGGSEMKTHSGKTYAKVRSFKQQVRRSG
jgi:hypothetical protein